MQGPAASARPDRLGVLRASRPADEWPTDPRVHPGTGSDGSADCGSDCGSDGSADCGSDGSADCGSDCGSDGSADCGSD
ncbi:MAG: hypothetical protein QNM02_06700, partial [Acidimicrobiia bacterium]|nr:hypothetical protein [Acidimicrobiia bacterium]